MQPSKAMSLYCWLAWLLQITTAWAMICRVSAQAHMLLKHAEAQEGRESSTHAYPNFADPVEGWGDFTKTGTGQEQGLRL